MQMVDVVTIASRDLAWVLRQAAASPVEICGLLVGEPGAILRVEAMANVADDPAIRFALDPAQLIAARRAARGEKLAVIGHYHSHPSGRAEPSAADAAAAHGDEALWLIVAAGGAELWRAVRGGSYHGAFDRVALRVRTGD